MSQFSSGILGAVATALTFGAAQFAAGRDLTGMPPESSRLASVAEINRAAKADRAVGVAAPALQMRTISIRLDGLSDMSILFRVPLAREARNGLVAPAMIKSVEQKATVACEPVVSVLTEIAKQLQPGRCVT